ncbi:hypothetical protein N7478_004262 [Penicillium angulare]|uniref:uncharacterized protein n=1 Tax=Penicillium angulare TaxID=116970 RepID=UPI0025404981|nr:uncharacterized protein N7478_004262 [Penicillium angulare]KAJ5278890.1 hypothetical protein N7478_004262 [Penicillium angulare]
MMDFVFYYYNPSTAAAVIFLVLFGISAVLHTYQLFRTRTWLMIPFLLGAYMETIGYIGRLLSAQQAPDFTKGPYIIQSLLILIAPAFLAASIYMLLGRIIRMIEAEKYALIRVSWMTKIFVAGDVLSFLMQASGAGLMVSSSSGPSLGEKVIIGGLFVQIIFFGFFTISAVIFQTRVSRSPTGRSAELQKVWTSHMATLYTTSILILVRSVVRVVEYIQGYDGFLMKHEVFIYVFDALPMLIAVVAMQYDHPSEINCILGRGEVYSEKVIKTRKYVPASVLELGEERV